MFRNNWISVDNQLPEDEQQVIAVINGKVEIAIYDAGDFYYSFNSIDGRMWTAHCDFKNVTHWQTLPQFE